MKIFSDQNVHQKPSVYRAPSIAPKRERRHKAVAKGVANFVPVLARHVENVWITL
jgi:hypothetical protein